MPNEFVIKNGYFSQGNSNITGSLTVTGGVTASLQGTASFAITAATASYILNAVSSSFATTASYYAETDPVFVSKSGSFTTTSSFNAFTSSYTTGSFTGSFIGNGSGLTGVISSSYALSSSYATIAATASYSPNLTISGSITSVNYIDFNTGSAIPAWKSGRAYWDNTEGALSVYNAEADITMQLGQENWVRVFNDGATINKGTAVRLVGSHGDVSLVVLAQPIAVTGSVLSQNQIIGVTGHTIETNSIGYVQTAGLISGLNTNTFADGDRLYVSQSAGIITNVPPTAPFEIIQVGVCVKAGPGGSGIILVDTIQPIDFADMSSAESNAPYAYGDLWTYIPSGSYGVWRHTNQLSGSYGLTGSLYADRIVSNITGSLFGTASNAISSSYAATASLAITSLNASDILIYVKNVTGAAINKGTVVRISGATGDNALIATASYEADNNSANTLGILNETIADQAFGYAMTEGKLLGINTDAFTAGQLLYLGATGSIIGYEPKAPLHAVRLGQALRIQQNNGSMYVRIDNGYELDELHNVLIISGSDGDLLVASGSNGNGKKLYINSRQLTGSYGLTGSLNVIGSVIGSLTGSFTGSLIGSLTGTASYATQALTSSYALNSQLLDGSDKAVFATTGSNVFKDSQIITGSLYITNDLVVFGSSSIQYITSSQLNIADNIITVNTITPAIRFGGLAVNDSGSATPRSGSLLFDSQNNQWIFVHQDGGSAVTSSVLIMGPQTFNNIGNESTITTNRLTKGTGGDLGEHIGDSNITDTGTVVSINSNTEVTGSVTITNSLTVGGTIIGNGGMSMSGSNNVTGSLAITHASGTVNIGLDPTANISVVTNNTTYSGRFITDSNTVNATGIYASSVGTNTNANIGVQGAGIGSTTLNIGVAGFCIAPTIGTNIGSYFLALSGSSNYSIQLRDGTETIAGRFLINQTTDGKANWGNSIPDIQITNAITGSTGNNTSTDAMIQASLLYLSNNC